MALLGSKKNKDAAAAATPGAAPAVPTRAVKEKRARPSKGALKNGSIVGLNIGNANIKAVEVVAKNGTLSVARAVSVPTPPDAYQNGNVLSVSALANAIKALWKAGGFKGKAVISSVAGTGALVVRVIEVPLMTDAQLADAMRADAQLYIPFPPTEVQMDFKALRELPGDPDSGTMDVLLAAAQSEIIDLHIKTLQAARLDPRAVDVEPIAAGRTLSLQKRGDFNGLVVDYNEITAVANIGAMGTEISLLRGDVLVFTRTVSTGGNTISQGIADALGVPLIEGERIKIEQGDALPPEGYQSGAGGGDEFGFGGEAGGFNGEFDDFGLNDSPAPGGANRTTVLDAPAQGNASTDPFDLDFFNQGPKPEQGGGHAQKEGQPNPGGGFSFDDFGLLPSSDPAPAESPAAQTPATPASTLTNPTTFNFDFDMSSTDLPAPVPAPPAPVAPISAATPTPVIPPTPVAPPAADFSFGGTSENMPNDFLPSTETPAPLAPPSTPPSTPMASAFDFSDFDLPAVAAPTASVAPVEAAPGETPVVATVAPTVAVDAPVVAPVEAITPAPGGGFSFGDLPDIAPAATTPIAPATDEVAAPTADAFDFGDEGVSLEKTVPEGRVVPLNATVITDNNLDVNDIFGESEHAAVAPDASGGVSFDDLNLGNAPDAGLNTGGMDDFGFDAGGDDFGGFGAGLAAGADAGSAAIYDALANSIEELAGEISRSLSFYLERVPDAALSRIYLTGGGALLKNLDVFLTGRLGAPTAVLNPLQLLPVAAQSEIPNGPLYTVALGLALRDFVD